MKVIQKIQTKNGPDAPVEVQFYSGDDHAQAISALVMASVGQNEHYSILSATIEF